MAKRTSTSIPFFRGQSLPLDKRTRRYAALRHSLRRENSQLSQLPLITEDEASGADMSERTPQSPLSATLTPTARTPGHPFPPSALAAFAADRPSRRLRRRELSHLMHDHRGSFLSTASLALVGVAPRASKSSSASDKDPNFPSFGVGEKKASVWRRTKQLAQYLYEKSRLKYVLPLLILVGYSFLGGAVIYWIEAPIERWQIEGKQRFLDDQKFILTRTLWQVRENGSDKRQALMTLRESVYWYTITTLYMEGNFTRLPPPTADVDARVRTLKKFTEQMAQRCWEIRLEINNQSDAQRKIQNSLFLFEEFTGVSTEVKPMWTFSNALFLAVTIYTTIGYGSVAPHTVAGRVATIIYAVIGIPIYVMIIHKLGRFCLKLLHKFWKFALRLTRYWRCARRSRRSKRHSLAAEHDEESVNNIPVSLAVGVTFAWMLTCAGVCCLFFETSWDYFTSFYFFFISLTTIGFGDVTPTHPDYMFTMFGLIIVGLSLVSMCINVVQLKLELLFEEMMLALMEEYEKSGHLVDGEMVVEPVDFQRGLGFSQMFKLWKKKRAAKKAGGDDNGVSIPATGLLLPLMARKRQAAVFRELQRRANERSTGTQTDQWIFDRLRNWLDHERGTQTEWTPGNTDTSSLITCSSGLPVNEGLDSEELYHSNLSMFPHVGCYSKHGIPVQPDIAFPDRSASCNREFEAPPEPMRPRSSMDTRTPCYTASSVYCTPSNLTPFTVTGKTASSPTISNIQSQHASRRGQRGALDARPNVSKGIVRDPYEYSYNLQVPHPGSGNRSTASSPIPYYYRTSPSAFAHHPQFDHGRYWLAHFRPEAPPGGGVPAMCITRQSKETSCDDFKTLIREIGCRLDECRHIVKQKE